MSVRQLGPAITALGDLLDRANYLLNGDSSTIDIKATATRSGSFGIDFAVEVVRVGATIFSGPIVVSALNIRQLVALTITWLKHLKREGKDVAHWTEDEVVKEMESIDLRVDGIELATSASPETNRIALETVKRLSQDRIVLKSLGQVAEPVSHNGVDRVDILDGSKGNGSKVLESIEKADLSGFEPPPQDTATSEHTIPRKMLTVIYPYLGDRTAQWRFSDGEHTDRYDMLDDSFAADVKSGTIEFRSKDVLVCEVRYLYSLDREDNITATTREILKVHSHNPISQLRLPKM